MIRFGALGAAHITPRALVYPCLDEPQASIYAIAARDRARAEAFAYHHRIPVVLETYEEVITHPKVDAVYIALPISAHREWTIRALRAGRHVLCEKSMALNAVEAREMADVAKETGLVLMDAFHYRYHPVFMRAREIVDSGELGRIERVQGAFHIPVRAGNDDIRLNYRTGGGVTMDIGCYPVSWVRHITGEEPEAVSAEAEVGQPDVDLRLDAKMRFPSGIAARTSGDMRPDARFKAELVVEGVRGVMTVRNPLVPQTGHRITVEVDGERREETRDRRPTYGYQLDAFLEAVTTGVPPVTDGEDGVRQMQAIDACYRAAGLPPRGS